VAFGGAGPLFASLLADEMDVDTVVIPSNAGNFSAVGLMQSDVSRSAARTYLRPLHDQTLQAVVGVATELAASFGPTTDEDTFELLLDLRYRGQEHSLTTSLAWILGGRPPAAAVVQERFENDYRAAYGLNLLEQVELVNVRVQRHTSLSVSRDAVTAPIWSDAPGLGIRPVWSFTNAAWMDTPVVERSSVPTEGVEGPMLVVEQTATTVVDAGFTIRAHSHETLLITRNPKVVS
jgi:N-methylhydantoinase A